MNIYVSKYSFKMCIPSKVFNSKFTTTGNETLPQKILVRSPMTEHLTLHKTKVDSIPSCITKQKQIQ